MSGKHFSAWFHIRKLKKLKWILKILLVKRKLFSLSPWHSKDSKVNWWFACTTVGYTTPKRAIGGTQIDPIMWYLLWKSYIFTICYVKEIEFNYENNYSVHPPLYLHLHLHSSSPPAAGLPLRHALTPSCLPPTISPFSAPPRDAVLPPISRANCWR